MSDIEKELKRLDRMNKELNIMFIAMWCTFSIILLAYLIFR